MKILPVLDLLNGVVVRGIAGRRESYRPIESRLTERHDVVGVADAIRDTFGFSEFYLADLDGIVGSSPNLDQYRLLRERGFVCHVDAGVRSAQACVDVIQSGGDSVIVGLETNPSRELLIEIVQSVGSDRVVFSVDLRGGELMGTIPGVDAQNSLKVVDAVVNLGVSRLILLDLHAVGTGDGPKTIPLCREVRRRFPHVELISGGGVRGVADLQLLQDAGVDAALVASALHNGEIRETELRSFLEERSVQDQ